MTAALAAELDRKYPTTVTDMLLEQNRTTDLARIANCLSIMYTGDFHNGVVNLSVDPSISVKKPWAKRQYTIQRIGDAAYIYENDRYKMSFMWVDAKKLVSTLVKFSKAKIFDYKTRGKCRDRLESILSM